MLIGWNVQMYRPSIKLRHSRRCVFIHVLVECVSPLANANPVGHVSGGNHNLRENPCKP
jgi:hypothetical protein